MLGASLEHFSASAPSRLAKTDAIEAQVLAHFAELIQPPTRLESLRGSPSITD